MVSKKAYDVNQILREMASLRGLFGNNSAAPLWVPIILDPTWVLLGGFAQPSYRIWKDGVHLELTGLADWGSNSTTTQTLNSGNPIPFAPLTTKNIKIAAGNYNTGSQGEVQITNTGVISMLCTASFTGRYCEINAVIPLDL